MSSWILPGMAVDYMLVDARRAGDWSFRAADPQHVLGCVGGWLGEARTRRIALDLCHHFAGPLPHHGPSGPPDDELETAASRRSVVPGKLPWPILARAMPKQYVVQQGDQLSGIAESQGFQSAETLWNAPENADLKALRKNPHVLLPGDVVVVPDRNVGSVTRPTGAMHAFTLLTEPLGVRVVFRDTADDPLAGVACTVALGDVDRDAATDGDGLLVVPVPKRTRFFEVLLGELEIPVQVGHLDPPDEPTGWQGRLKNLGYYAGLIGAEVDDVHMRLAVEEFQLEQGLPVTGEVDPTTQAALLDAHGC